MKKLLLLLVGILVFAMGCTAEKEVPVVRFNVEEGKQIVEHYLTSLLRHDTSAVEKYLVGNAVKVNKTKLAGLSFSGYSIVESNDADNGAQYVVKLSENNAKTPYYAADDMIITMTKNNEGSYVISDTVIKETLKVTQKGDSLMATENNEDTKTLSLSELPNKATSQDATAKELEIAKKAFGPIALSPDRAFLLFSTNGTNGFLGMYNLSNKQVTPIDIFPGQAVGHISWSPRGNTYAVEKIAPSGISKIILYDAGADKRFSFRGEQLFDKPQYHLSNPFFGPTSFYYQVKADKNKSISGWWVYNFDNSRLGKLLR